MDTKILFITNKRSLPYTCNDGGGSKITNIKLSSGLVNSVKFVVEMLKYKKINASYVQVNDGNEIDSWVTKEQPTHVIIEALWVTPKKLNELVDLHKTVKWYVRLHSEIPFLSNEGVAFSWLFQYIKIPNVNISANSLRIVNELQIVLETPVIYLPNYYKLEPNYKKNKNLKSLDVINISCFGAIRPMKNQLLQAVSAIIFSKEINKKINFHINVNREETGGNSVLKNIRSLFENTDNVLVEHPWCDHDSFMEIVKTMDIGMQVSFSETYNIVAADLVNAGIPIVVSEEIKFVDDSCVVKTTSSADIVKKLKGIYYVYNLNRLIEINRYLLERDSNESIKYWIRFVSK
jgi:hypothetical protein